MNCNNSKVLCNDINCLICYEKSLLSHDKHIYIYDKEINNPRYIFKYSNRRVEFKCEICNHIFESIVNNITDKNRWCSFCSNKKLCEDNDCEICYKKSFASHIKSEYIVDKVINNPRYIFLKSEKNIEFKCNNCNHNFISMVGNITSHNTWCSYCSNPPKKLCENNNCEMCFKNSFASHEKSIYWSKKNLENPRNVFLNSNKKFYFECNCGHTFETNLGNINISNNWCPYCCNPPLKLCQNNDCISCYNNSFASHEKSKYLNANNINPRNIFKGTHEKYDFICNECKNNFTKTINSITNMNSWCNVCKNKTEKKLYLFLKNTYMNVKPQFIADWCKNKKTNQYFRFDFLLIDLNIIVELDGAQHFKQISNWQKPEITQECDIYKMKKAIENNYSVIRLLQNDVFYDKIDWKNLLIKNIKFYLKPSIIYIDTKNEYKEHKNIFNEKNN